MSKTTLTGETRDQRESSGLTRIIAQFCCWFRPNRSGQSKPGRIVGFGSGADERDWAWLSKGILDNVLSNLVSSSDYYVRFSCVCKRWHSIATDQLRRHIDIVHHHKRLPFHLIRPATARGLGRDKRWRLSCIIGDKLLELKLEIPNPIGKLNCGSSHGWLAFWEYENDRISLFNPFTGAQISLPPLFTDSSKNNPLVFNVVLSADPCLYPDDCIVAASIVTSSTSTLFKWDTLAIRPGRDEKWTLITPNIVGRGQWKTIKGEMRLDKNGKWLYAVGLSGMIVRANIENFSSDGSTEWEVVLDHSRGTQYLVEASNGDLLMILWPVNHVVERPKVFKVQGSRVVEVDDLNGDVILIGHKLNEFDQRTLTTAVAAQDFQGMEANCIYQWSGSSPSSSEIWEFDVKDKKISRRPVFTKRCIAILPAINFDSKQG